MLRLSGASAREALTTLGVVVLLTLLLMRVCPRHAPPAPPPTNSDLYEQLPSIPEPATGAAAAGAGGRVYIFGGSPANAPTTDATRIYDPATRQWSFGKPMPEPRYGLGAVAAGGRIYVVGGVGEGGVSRRVGIYDVELNTWARGPELPAAVSYADGVEAVRSLIVAIGGHNGERSLRSVFVLDTAHSKPSWERRTDKEFATSGFGSAVVDGRVYCIGGHSGGETYLADVEVYDPDHDEWDFGPPLHARRSNGGAVAIGDAIYLFGGGRSEGIPKEVPVLRPEASSWDSYDDLPLRRSDPDVVECDGWVYVLGGGDGAGPCAEAWRTRPR